MLVYVLAALAALLVVTAALWFGLAFVMRRPALARRLMRVPPLRFLMARMAALGMRAARRRAEKDGTIPAGRHVSDLEVALAASDSAEARRARAMLARMNPRERNQLSRMTLGADGLAGLMNADLPAQGDDQAAEMLGRAGRRRQAVVGGSEGREAQRQAQRRRAVAKRRAARKATR